MTKQYFGKRITRNEDPRILTGQALFTDDVQLPGMLHAAFVRSIHAHGIIKDVDVSAALEIPGVVAIYKADDLGDYWQPGPLLVPPPPIERLTFNPRTHFPLAKDKVRHVGEPIAVVIAESRYIAEDAIEQIFVDIEPLEAVVELEKALEADSPKIHDDLDTNMAAHVTQEKGSYDSTTEQAAITIKRRFHYDRGIAAALENRGIVASWDNKNDQLTVWDTTQAPIPIRNGLTQMLGLAESQVQVIAPFIGGGFGPKIMMFYPEEIVIPWVTMQLGRPIKWIEDREENFFATTHERSQVHDSEITLDKDGKILGVKDIFIHDSGAYIPYGLTVPINSQCTLLGPYKIPNYYSDFKVVFTNKTIVTPYRGAGRQHGVFVMERLLDLAAKELGLSTVEIRRRNLLQPKDFPHNHEIIYQDFAPLVYDSGDYEPALTRAAEMIEFEKFYQEEKEKLRKEGKYCGLGIVSYIEGTGIGPYEGARVTIGPSGKVNLAVGVGTQGQGHYTSFAQIVAEVLQVDVRDIRVVTGDTKEFGWGTGTFASRGAVVAGTACHEAAVAVKKKVLKLASEVLETEEDDLEVLDAKVSAKSSDKSILLKELAAKANPLRGAVKPGTEPGLEATAYFGPNRGTTGNGVHAMIVEVDPETMLVDIKKFVVVHDCGRVINPMIVDGQIHGGVAQGIGNAFYEQLHFDKNGQLLNASFMDYLLPTSTDVPPIETDHLETPSPLNSIGVKGVGEAGAIPVGALFAQAVEDAFSEINLEILEIPLSPNRLFELVQAAKANKEAGA